MENENKYTEEFEIKNDNYLKQVDYLKMLAEEIKKHEKEKYNIEKHSEKEEEKENTNEQQK